MAIDTSIYSQVGKGGDLGNFVDSYNANQAAKIQRRLSDLQLSEAERNAAQGKAVSEAYSGNIGSDGTINRTGMINQLASSGQGGAIPGLQKSWADQDKAATEASAKKLEMAKKQLDYFNGSMSGLLALPEITDDALIRAASDAVNRGFLGQDEAISFVRGLPPDQGGRRSMLMSGVMQSTDASKRLDALLPKVQAQNLGGTTQMVDVNPLTNPNVVGQTLPRTATPGEVEAARHNRVQEGQAAANADRTANAANWTFNKDLGVLVNSKTGETRKAEGGDTERVRDAKDAIELITQAQDLLKKGPTGSYGGAAIDAGLRTLGMSTKGADIAAQLKALEGALVSKMPKMSGPQSDKDVAMYKQMAATIGDSTIPVRQRLAALDQVLEIQQRYAGIKPQGEAAPNINGGVLTPPQTPKNQRDQQVQAKMLQQAKDAIASGAPKEAVIQRLQTMGIDPKGL